MTTAEAVNDIARPVQTIHGRLEVPTPKSGEPLDEWKADFPRPFGVLRAFLGVASKCFEYPLMSAVGLERRFTALNLERHRHMTLPVR